MARKRNSISQREARALRREVEQLRRERDRQRSAWAAEYPGGVNIAQATYGSSTEFLPAVIHNSRKLGHAVVCLTDGATVRYFALPLPGR